MRMMNSVGQDSDADMHNSSHHNGVMADRLQP
jgi:hypothetical protein